MSRQIRVCAAALAALVGGMLLPVAAGCGAGGGGANDGMPDWLTDARILVPQDISNEDCRTAVCAHNENTDLTRYDGAIYLVHRTAESQILGPNSSLRVYRSDDSGKSFDLLAVIPAPTDRDIRDPHFFTIGDQLAIKALTRLPVVSSRDSDVDTIAVLTTSSDQGRTWSPLSPIGPETWSFWRIRQVDGVDYTAAYEDGDKSVVLFTSRDGTTWDRGAVIYDVSDDTPLETELVFMPSGRLLALVRMDGTDDELLGSQGRLRTKVCWSTPPYDQFDCPQELTGQRLDGPLAFFHQGRLFVVAREHLADADRKRTALFEIGGTLEGGPITITALGDFPSAGDTAYAGAVDVDADHVLVSWYSSNTLNDEPWARAILEPSDIWVGTIDFSRL